MLARDQKILCSPIIPYTNGWLEGEWRPLLVTVFAKTLVLFYFPPLVSLGCYCLFFVKEPFWGSSCWILEACAVPNKLIWLTPGDRTIYNLAFCSIFAHAI